MIFTPEESREIAVEMLGWACISSGTLRWLEPPDQEHVYVVDGSDLPDFSIPEWTGPMLVGARKICLHYDICFDDTNYVTIRDLAEFTWTFKDTEELNYNLYCLWKWLRGKKGATDVRP